MYNLITYVLHIPSNGGSSQINIDKLLLHGFIYGYCNVTLDDAERLLIQSTIVLHTKPVQMCNLLQLICVWHIGEVSHSTHGQLSPGKFCGNAVDIIVRHLADEVSQVRGLADGAGEQALDG